MLETKTVRAGSSAYRAQCRLARRVYVETIGVEPTSYPPTFISLQKNRTPVGGVGIWWGLDTQSFLTEQFCAGQGVDLAALYAQYRVTSRAQVAEACCLHVVEAYRKSHHMDAIFAAVYQYLSMCDVRVLLLTQSAVLHRVFRRLETEVHTLCEPDLKDYNCSGDIRERWSRRYFQKLRPTCCLLDVRQAIAAYHSARIPALVPSLLPQTNSAACLVNA